MSNNSTKKKILFLCTGNSCRSQIAEGLCRSIHNDRTEVFSAGIEKHGLNPYAVKVMSEVGIDISNHKSKLVTDIPVIKFDYVFTVCGHANENCPLFSGNAKVIHAGFQDPPKMAEKCKTEEEKINCYREVRDQIKNFIVNLDENM